MHILSTKSMHAEKVEHFLQIFNHLSFLDKVYSIM